MFDSNQFFGVSAAGGFYPKTIDQSLRFEDGDGAYLSQTFGQSGDSNKTFTFSFWFKRGSVTTTQYLFVTNPASSSAGYIYIDAGGQFVYYDFRQGGNGEIFRSNALLRDPSAWYHIVVSVDYTAATDTDRAKIYINGNLASKASGLYPNNTTDSSYFNFGSNPVLYISANPNYLDGYLAEVHFTDGTSYTADAFGELKSGIWVAKSPSVTYGTNGFKLTFEDSAAIGDDTSGNGNDWTVNNLVASDVVLDSPTNNFAVLNSVNKDSVVETREGNLKAVCSAANQGSVFGTFGPQTGKWYWEVLIDANKRGVYGYADAQGLNRTGLQIGSSSTTLDRLEDGSATSVTGDASTGSILAFAFDLDAKSFTVYLNGSSLTTGTYSNTEDLFPFFRDNSGSAFTTNVNFGQDSTFAGNLTAGGNSDDNGIGDFKYAPPSGFLALCTANLPDPVIDPAQDATPEDHFNVVTYSGNSSSLSVTGVGFEPDFTWIKNRTSASDYHTFFDKVRGTNGSYYSFLLCPYTGTEDYAPQGGNGGFGAIETFDTDGFTLDSSNSDWSRTNESGQDYVAFNWSLPTTVSGSTAGVGTSQSYTGRANADAGVSIIAYSGNNSGGHRIPHHLNEAPEFVICKGRTFLQGWPAYHAYQDITNPEDIYLELNTTNYRNQDNALFWNDTKPDSTHVTLGSIAWLNGSGYDYVMYSFHSVDGFSKVGQYTGNGSATDGTFVYTGFRPKWVMIKQVSSAGWGWYIFDSERSQDNVVDDYINAASVAGEVSNSTTADIDFLSNGFKLRGSFQGTNENLMDFSYLAFAEQPAKYSNAR